MPEILNQIQTFRFDEMAVLVKDRIDNPAEADVDRYVGLEHLDSNSLKIRHWGEPTDVEATKLLFKAGDIIFGKRRVYQRKLAVADFEGICSAHAMVLRAKPEVVLPEFLPFFMQSDRFMERALKISVGSLSPTINWKTLAKEKFALPPLEEQRRIAEVLEAATDVANTMAQAFTAANQAHRALRLRVFNHDVDAARAPAKQMPTGWEMQSIRDVAEFLDGRRIPLKSADRAQRQGSIPYYGASGIIDYIDDHIFDEDLVLVSEDGANLLDRNTPIAFEVSGKYWVNNHAHVLRAIPPFSNFLIAEFFESINIQPYVTGTAQPKLNKAACERIPIPKPSPEELCQIEVALQTSVATRDACKQRAADARTLFRSALSSIVSSSGVMK